MITGCVIGFWVFACLIWLMRCMDQDEENKVALTQLPRYAPKRTIAGGAKPRRY